MNEHTLKEDILNIQRDLSNHLGFSREKAELTLHFLKRKQWQKTFLANISYQFYP